MYSKPTKNPKIIAIGLLMLFSLICKETQCQIPNPKQVYPRNVHLVPLSNASNLQSELDTYKVIRLEQGDYNVNITLSSDCEIYGLPDTELGTVTVSAGTTGAVLSSVNLSELSFPASTAVTKHNLFRRIKTSLLSVDDGRLEENLFLDIDGKIQIITDEDGYLRNNRFIRCRIHSVHPSFTMIGDSAGNSYQNVFLWFNILTPQGNATIIENQKDLTFVGIDAETWNYSGKGGNPLIDTEDLGTLRIFGLGGGAHTDSANLTQLMDIDADVIQAFNVAVEKKLISPNIEISDQNVASYFFDVYDYSRLYPTSSFQVEAFIENSDITINSSAATASLINSNLTEFTKFTDPVRTGGPWERPTFETINLGTGLVGNPSEDHTSMIQNMIDSAGVAFLDSGVYYISSSLEIGKDEGIIGQGKGITVIRAKSDTIDMIVSKYDDNRPDFIVAELTLEGGRNGIHLYLNNSGTYRICTGNFISHVGFYDLDNAGILLNFPDGSGGTFDNNFIDNSYFVQCGTGVKQVTGGTSCSSQCSLMDKIVFYQTQFISCGKGVDLQTVRGDHKNGWINCKFEDNSIKDVDLINNVGPLFANCEFNNSSGDAVIDNNLSGTMVVSCDFNVGSSLDNILPHGTHVEGSTFNGSNTPIFSSSTSKGMFYQSDLDGIDMSNMYNGVLVNTSVSSSASLNKKFIWIKNGSVTTLLNSVPNPQQQLLFGVTYATPEDCIDEQNSTIAYKVSSAPTIDGNLSESAWCIANSISKTVIGTSDNDAHFGVLWDDNYLYVGVEVLDANLYEDVAGYHNNDGIEVYVDPNHHESTTYESDDRAFNKVWNRVPLQGTNTTGVIHTVVDITGGYAIEMAIPWSNLTITPSSGMTIGFDIAVNDDDNGGTREGQLMWTGTANNWINTSAFGDIVLSNAAARIESGSSELKIMSEQENTDVLIYPNPLKGSLLNIRLTNIEQNAPIDISVFDITGRKVYHKNNVLETKKTEMAVDLSHLPAGIFTIQVKTIGGTWNKKLIKN